MNIFVRRLLGYSLLGLVSTAGVIQAGQQVTFHLPFTAKWAFVELAAGDYTVSLPEVGMPLSDFIVSGEGKRALIPIMYTDTNYNPNTYDGRSFLTLRNVDGVYYVENYVVGPSSKEFSFKVPRPGHKLQIGKDHVRRLEVMAE